MKSTTTITLMAAIALSNTIKEENKIEYNRILEEVKTSDFSVLTSMDIHHYVSELNRLSSGSSLKKLTANDLREINRKETGASADQYLNSFIDDETDDIFDFF